MRRREVIAALGGLAAVWPLGARSYEPQRIARIGILSPTSSERMQPYYETFREGLRELGYLEGRNLQIEYRYTDGNDDQLAGQAAELVGLNVDVIVTYASGLYPAKRATTTIPIVMFVGADVVEMGLVASLAHPGGNITGSTFFYSDLMAKRLELLKTIAPSTTRAAVFVLKDNPANAMLLEKMGETAKALNIALLPVTISGLQEILEALSSFSDAKVGGVVGSDTARILVHAQAIAAFATKNGLPAVGPSEFPQSGGLVGYGVEFLSLFHRTAAFVDRILKGEKPADMPIERATTFKLVLNLKTANALGLTVPPILLATADEAIE